MRVAIGGRTEMPFVNHYCPINDDTKSELIDIDSLGAEINIDRILRSKF